MATYRSIAASETDAQSPITQELMDALAANPTAISEGASGAPKQAPASLAQNATAAQGTGSTTIETATGSLAGCTYMLVVVGTNSTGSNVTARWSYRTSTDGGATKTGLTNLYNSIIAASSDVSDTSAGILTFPADTNYVEFDGETDSDVDISIMATAFGEMS